MLFSTKKNMTKLGFVSRICRSHFYVFKKIDNRPFFITANILVAQLATSAPNKDIYDSNLSLPHLSNYQKITLWQNHLLTTIVVVNSILSLTLKLINNLFVNSLILCLELWDVNQIFHIKITYVKIG